MDHDAILLLLYLVLLYLLLTSSRIGLPSRKHSKISLVPAA